MLVFIAQTYSGFGNGKLESVHYRNWKQHSWKNQSRLNSEFCRSEPVPFTLCDLGFIANFT